MTDFDPANCAPGLYPDLERFEFDPADAIRRRRRRERARAIMEFEHGVQEEQDNQHA